VRCGHATQTAVVAVVDGDWRTLIDRGCYGVWSAWFTSPTPTTSQRWPLARSPARYMITVSKLVAFGSPFGVTGRGHRRMHAARGEFGPAGKRR
jgi:hypothetical protein